MTQASVPAEGGRACEPYVSTPTQRRALGTVAVSSAGFYLAATIIAGPSGLGKVVESSIMATAAFTSAALSLGFRRQLNDAMKLPWAALGTGIGLYSIVFVLQAAGWAGCESCGPAAAIVAVAGWLVLGCVFLWALRLAYRYADARLWSIEILDALAVAAATALWLALLVELDAIVVPRPFLSVDFVEVVGLPLVAAALVFTMRSVSSQIAHYKTAQSLFLIGVLAWVLGGSWNARGYEEIAWVAFALGRATTLACAVLIPAYGLARGVSLEILDVAGAEDRPVTDVSVMVAGLGAGAVIARLFAEPESVVHRFSLPVLAAVTLLLVVRLALTSGHHRRLEGIVTDSSARYRDLVEEAHQGILEVDAEGGIRYSNEAAALIIGCDRSSLTGRDIGELMKPVRIDFAELESAASTDADSEAGIAPRLRAGSRVVARVPDSEGKARYVELTPSPSDGRGPVKTLLRDVTVEVEQRMQVADLIRDLRAKDAERSALMRDMLETAESERYSIASQLHDGPVQHLTLLALKTDLLRRKLAEGSVAEVSSACREIAEEVGSEAEYISELSNALSPSVRPDVDLEVSLEGLMHSVFSPKGTAGPVSWRVSASGDLSCTATAKITLYRCLQAIALDARISGARRAEVELGTKDTWVFAKFVTDAALNNARARGVARAKVWTLQLGGVLSESRRGALYEAELQIPSSAEEPG